MPGMGHGDRGTRRSGDSSGPRVQAARSASPSARRVAAAPRAGPAAAQDPGVGFLLMIVNRLSSLVLPLSTRTLIDTVIGKQRMDLLTPLVLGILGATLIQGVTSFALTQILSKAGQRLIAELRQKVQRHIGLLPVSYYDTNKSGVLVSRIMNDVEGVRNLIGTGLVDFVGGLLTAVISLGVSVVHQRDHDDRHGGGGGLLRFRPEQSVYENPAGVPRTREDHRGSDRPVDRVAGRRARRQGLPRGRA